MNKTLCAIKKAVLVGLATIILLLVTAIGGVIIYQDRILSLFWTEINKSLKYPVEAGKTTVTFWTNFPNLSIVLEQAKIMAPDFSPVDPVLKAQTVVCELSLLDLLTRNLRVKKILARDGSLGLLINNEGKANYFILKEGSSQTGGASINLPSIQFNNFSVTFSDDRTDLHAAFELNQIQASVLYSDPELLVSLKGDLIGKFLGLGELEFEGDKDIELDAYLGFNRETRNLRINPSSVSIRKSSFEVTGNYRFDESRDLDLMIEGKETNLQSLLSLLPGKYSQPLEAYQSQGNVEFSASIIGKLAESRPAKLDVSFKGHDVSFYHPDYQTRIEQLSFSGSFRNGDQRSIESTNFSIHDIDGKLGGKGFKASLELADLSNPHISLSLETEQELGKLLQFFPVDRVHKASGSVQLDIALDGRLNDLKNVNTATKFSTSGQISLKDVNLKIADVPFPAEGLNGDLIFNKSDLAISDLSGQWGQTDFLISGLFKNVLSYFFFEDQLLVIQVDLISQKLELEEILSSGQEEQEEYQLNISPKIEIGLNCEIKNLVFQRFKGRDFKGQIHIKDQMISAPTLTFRSAGGKVTASVDINAQDQEQTVIHTKSSFEGIEIDSVFYVFKNFEQDFLVDSNLKGQIYADLDTRLILDQGLNLKSETLISDISFSIRNGELNQFEPMERLGKYIKYGDLSRLKFSELKNELQIKDRTVFIPEMEIRSNVSNIVIQGTHTFDQLIDYRLKVPLNNKPSNDKDEMFGAIEEDAAGKAQLFLTIKGTADDYKIAYDKRAVAHKIKDDIKGEGRELVETFKDKGKKDETEVELEEEEFFDFEKEDQ